MRVLSVNVGQPRLVQWRNRTVSTGIFKSPVAGSVAIRRHNLDGDRQADLSVHGGPDKAVYAYPSEHDSYWHELRGGEPLTSGAFGENLTTEGLIETEVCIGDEFRVGTARLVVAQPRMPCYKLGVRFNDPGVVKQFLASGRPGIYFAVAAEGEVAAGDAVECVARDPRRLTVVELLKLILDRKPQPDELRRALEVPALPAEMRVAFEARLQDG